MLTYEKAISDLIEKFDEDGVYLSDQNRWAVDVAFGAMIDMAKELDKEHEEKQHESQYSKPITCPIRFDLEADSKEVIAQKWEEIRQWYKDHPEVLRYLWTEAVLYSKKKEG